ncbi:hypothetical protein LWI28_008646 [Acer negundo]|uniref:ubiquitinyl hydrolase 1 n=1 Tax=Acer negundo TaxID=4023 RepID=A0AAD5ICY1_ACENE|nr:hypothetical protein LWI28_008646 [Acer negundo]
MTLNSALVAISNSSGCLITLSVSGRRFSIEAITRQEEAERRQSQAAKSDLETSSPAGKTANGPKKGQLNGVRKEPLVTWFNNKLFEKILVRQTLNAEDKFFCDKCCSLQDAQKWMKIKRPPHILVIHLKQFKYIEQLGRYKKLSYRVVFPLELKLSNTVEDADIKYSIFAVVVM